MPATAAMRRMQTGGNEQGQPRLKHKGKPVVFSQNALEEFVTGFRKRRQQRRAEGAAQAARKERQLRLQDRKDRREALKAEIAQKLRKRQREAGNEDEDEDEWRKKSRGADEQQNDDADATTEAEQQRAEEEQQEANEQSDVAAVKDEAGSVALAWKYEDESAVVTVRTHAPGEDEEDEDEEGERQPGAASERYETGSGFAERQARRWSGGQPSQKKAVVKPKKKDRKGPRKMMKSKKEKALGIKKKPRFRGR